MLSIGFTRTPAGLATQDEIEMSKEIETHRSKAPGKIGQLLSDGYTFEFVEAEKAGIRCVGESQTISSRDLRVLVAYPPKSDTAAASKTALHAKEK